METRGAALHSADTYECGADFLLFRSRGGATYLFDAASATVHAWPLAMDARLANAVYDASDEALQQVLAGLTAPAWFLHYVLQWRLHGGAFLTGADSSAGAHACGRAGCTADQCHGPLAPRWSPTPAVLSNLVLVVTDGCNLRCTYCLFSGAYEHFHSHRPRTMTREVALAAIDTFYELNRRREIRALPHRKLDIAFFGGEPLLCGDLLREVVDYAEPRRPSHAHLQFSLTTNLVALPDELARFLVEKRIALNVSIDGPKTVHDRFRRDPTGAGSFDRLRANLEKLRALDAGYFASSVRVVLTLNFHTPLGEVMQFFDEAGEWLPPIAFSGWVREDDHGGFYEYHPYDKKVARNGYRAVLSSYLNRKARRAEVPRGSFLDAFVEQPLLALHARIMKNGRGTRSNFTGTCDPGRRLSVATDGRIHLCERIHEAFPIGDVWSGLDLDACERLLAHYAAALPECHRCWARSLCTACFAQVGVADGFEFTRRKCDTIREAQITGLRLLYAAREAALDGLVTGDPLIDAASIRGVP